MHDFLYYTGFENKSTPPQLGGLFAPLTWINISMWIGLILGLAAGLGFAFYLWKKQTAEQTIYQTAMADILQNWLQNQDASHFIASLPALQKPCMALNQRLLAQSQQNAQHAKLTEKINLAKSETQDILEMMAQ
jgi:type II secretory pathway component PulF